MNVCSPHPTPVPLHTQLDPLSFCAYPLLTSSRRPMHPCVPLLLLAACRQDQLPWLLFGLAPLCSVSDFLAAVGGVVWGPALADGVLKH